MTITLTPDIEVRLTEEARKTGTTPQELALQCLRTRFVGPEGDKSPTQEEGSLADFLADHVGVLASNEQVPGGAQLSQDSGKKFATGMVEKRRRGRL